MAYRTYFEILGVKPEDGDDDVDYAYWAAIDEHGKDRLPVEIEDAYHVLRTAAGRRGYDEILRCCNDLTHLEVAADDADAFRALCRRARIDVWPDPKTEGHYHVRLPGQAPPAFTVPPPPLPPAPESSWSQIRRAVWQFASLQWFAGTTVSQKLGLVIVYVIVIGALAFGGKWGVDTLAEYRATAMRADIEANHTRAVETLVTLEAAAAQFDRDFAEVVGTNVGSRQMSREVDDAILKHESFRDAWATIQNEHVSQLRLAETRDELDRIERRIASGVHQDSDRERLAAINTRIEQNLETLAKLEDPLRHLQVILRARSLEERLDATEGSEP